MQSNLRPFAPYDIEGAASKVALFFGGNVLSRRSRATLLVPTERHHVKLAHRFRTVTRNQPGADCVLVRPLEKPAGQQDVEDRQRSAHEQ